MSPKRERAKVDGWLNLDKPLGITSAAAVGRVRRLFNAAKVGHAGTLDPLASGVLPIALGEATKTVGYAVAAAKAYRLTVRWGAATASDDSEGEIIAESAVRPDRAAILAALPAFRGRIHQVPPAFSAIHVGGQRAYRLARAGQAVTLAPREVEILDFDLEALLDPDRAQFIVRCSKGSYMRSLARDLAVALGTLGHVADLRRIAVGGFDEADAIPLDKLEALGHSAAAFSHLRSVETALDDIPALAMSEADCRRLSNGQSVRMPQGSLGTDRPAAGQSGVVRAHLEGGGAMGRLVALAMVEGDMLRPLRVINL